MGEYKKSELVQPVYEVGLVPSNNNTCKNVKADKSGKGPFRPFSFRSRPTTCPPASQLRATTQNKDDVH